MSADVWSTQNNGTTDKLGFYLVQSHIYTNLQENKLLDYQQS